jgi:hypothetical protein
VLPVEGALDRPVLGVDPDLGLAEYGGGAVEVGVDRALLPAGGVPVDREVDRAVIGHPTGIGLRFGVLGVRHPTGVPAERPLRGGLPDDDDPDPGVGERARLW